MAPADPVRPASARRQCAATLLTALGLASPIEVPFAKLGTGIGYDAKVAAWNYPDPWKGGTWHLGDIVAYQMTALTSITKSASLDREQFLSDFYAISSRAVHPTSG